MRVSAVTLAYGRNDHLGQQAALGEFTRQSGACTFSPRLEFIQAENELLLDDTVPASTSGHGTGLDPVGAFTVGAIRRLGLWHGLDTGLGVNAGTYAVPSVLRSAYGAHPFSFQPFVQVRPRVGRMGPMWNMRWESNVTFDL